MSILFVSDIHLQANHPELSALFFKFLIEKAPSAERVYILGDLFNAWLGDDDNSRYIQEIKEALKQCSQHTRIYLMVGNRDFLLGEHFCQQTGCHLLPDPSVIDLYGTPTLLVHGDSLCTDDKRYQQFRQRVRQPEWQQRCLRKPLWLRRAIAFTLRKMSRRYTQQHANETLMDVNQEAVNHALQTHGVTQLIHGHTHRPGLDFCWSTASPTQRFTLSDWHQQGHVLEFLAAQDYRMFFFQ